MPHAAGREVAMTISLTLSPDQEKRLRERATAAGQELSVYVSRLLERFAEPLTPMEEISAPVYRQFVESGMTDDELGDLLERAKHEMRVDRRGRGHR